MKYEDFLDSFNNKILPNKETYIRNGQSLMNYLGEVWFNEYVRITSTEVDCFYRDELIMDTLGHLHEVWVNYPN